MEEIDLSNLSDAEIIDMYSDIVESGLQIAALKTDCGLGAGSYSCCCSGFRGCCSTAGYCVTQGGVRC